MDLLLWDDPRPVWLTATAFSWHSECSKNTRASYVASINTRVSYVASINTRVSYVASINTRVSYVASINTSKLHS